MQRSLFFPISFFCALPFPLVSFILYFRHFPGEEAACFTRSFIPPVGIGVAVVFGLAYYAVLSMRNQRAFAFAGISLALIVQTVVVIFSFIIHRDFFTAVFQNFVAFICLFLYRAYAMAGEGVDRRLFKTLGQVGYGIFFLWAFWVMMMGYAIATRLEPRQIESLLYNTYNCFLGILVLAISRGLISRSRRVISIGPGSVKVDDKSVDLFLGEKGRMLILAFLKAPEHKLSCGEIQAVLRNSPRYRSGEGENCEACVAASTKATLCPAYRRTYNKILDLKRTLELLEIGTIVSPDNKRRILKEGWKLMLFEDVHVEVHEH